MSNVYLVFGAGRTGIGNVSSTCRNKSYLFTPVMESHMHNFLSDINR